MLYFISALVMAFYHRNIKVVKIASLKKERKENKKVEKSKIVDNL